MKRIDLTWKCQDCGYESPWWRGCERFLWCTECERLHTQAQRELIRASWADGGVEQEDTDEQEIRINLWRERHGIEVE